MISRTSWVDRGLMRLNCKRYWFVGAICLLFLLLTLPLQLLMREPIPRDSAQYGNLLLQFDSIYVFCGILPVVAAVCVFRYLQNGRSAVLMHGLPYNRKQLFVSNYLSGFLPYAVPLMVTFGVLLLIKLTPHGVQFTYTDAWMWLGVTLLEATVVYSFSVFVGMFTGSTIAQIAFIVILNFLPYVFLSLGAELLDGWLYGFAAESMRQGLRVAWGVLPVRMPLFLGYFADDLPYVLHAVYVIGFTGLAFVAYRKRQVETSGDVVAFRWVRPVFVYGVALCAVLVGTCYVDGVTGMDPNLLVMLLWATVGFVAAKMLVKKTFRIWGAYKEYLCFAGVIVVLFLAVQFDWLGFSARVPDPADVQGVYVGRSVHADMPFPEESTTDQMVTVLNDRSGGFYVAEPQNVALVTQLHQRVVDEGDRLESDGIYFQYQLKNGRMLVRRLPLDSIDPTAQLEPLYDSAEFKNYRYPILRSQADRILSMTVAYESGKVRRQEPLKSEEELYLLTGAMQQDISEAGYEAYVTGVDSSLFWINISYFYQVRDIEGHWNTETAVVRFAVLPGFTYTAQFLEKAGYYDRLQLRPEEVSEVVMRRLVPSSYPKAHGAYMESNDEVTVTDEAQIASILARQLEMTPYLQADLSWVALDVVLTEDGERYPLGYIDGGKLPADVVALLPPQ